MDRFSKLHPSGQMLYFIFVFILSVCLNNIYFSLVTLFGAMAYQIVLRGKYVLKSVKLTLFLVFIVGLFNMLFVHYGAHILFSVSGISFTLESLVYGINQGIVLSAVIVWFDAFSRVADSDRIIYMFRFAPKLALMFSMVLGFIPRFSKKLQDIDDANVALNGGAKPQGVKNKIKVSINNLSALVTYSLESSIITANSMEAREYNPKAVRGKRYKFMADDAVLITLSVALFAVVLTYKVLGKINFDVSNNLNNINFNTVCFVFYLLFCLIPSIYCLWEDLLWKLSTVKK